MVFAEFRQEPDFDVLVELLKTNFDQVTYGRQGDDWIWVEENGVKVEIDTFWSMELQVKTAFIDRPLIHRVLKLLEQQFDIECYNEPRLEPHE